MADHEDQSEGGTNGAARHPRRSRAQARWIGIAAGGAVVAAAIAWWAWPVSDVETVTAYGIEYTTNVKVEEHGGYVYVYVPVNAKTGSVVLEVENKKDSQHIREFLDSLDTFVPGEHVVSTSEMNLHFIVDGMAE